MAKIPIKTREEEQAMREGGQILAETLQLVCAHAKAGISTYELDKIAEEFIRSKNAIPSFKGHNGFPGTICSAIDEIIVHGIPSKTQILKEGDLFTVDCGVTHKGLITDAARSIGIGEVSNEKKQLIKTAHLALEKGINAARPGNFVGDISKAIEKVIRDAGFKVIRDLTGHGIGRRLHEPPVINNYFAGRGDQLKPGMTIAIEPIFAVSSGTMIMLEDKWTLVTTDGSCSIQEENTILITKTGNEVLTKIR